MVLLAAMLLLFSEESAESLNRGLKRLVDLFATLEQNAADPVNPAQAFYEGAIPGALRQLDPHTIFFDPLQFEQLKELEKSTRKGFGSVVSILPGRVIVLQTLPGTPSAKSGISAGDEIIAINGIRLDLLQIEQLVQLLQQSRQQPVVLNIRRPGNARIIQLRLTPEDVDSPSVERAFSLRPGIGYVRVSSFDAKTGEQLAEAIEKLGGSGLTGLVLDLRNNPGGVMGSALDTASLFLDPGKEIVSVRGRSVAGERVVVPKEAKPYKFPLAVLINAESASGSEIVAGALQDHGRAAIVGETSFGKGLVQSVFPLSQGTGMALTTAFYYTPEGKSIQRRLLGQLEKVTAEGQRGGIHPDEVVYPAPVTPLRAVLEASGSFTTFATQYLQNHRGTSADFEVTAELLDQFQTMLSEQNIRPGVNDWSKEREWIRSRLLQEILNQAVGVEKGDEVEARMDPVVQAAIRALISK